jgi:thiol-disulfide isomerase/thioredoxin
MSQKLIPDTQAPALSLALVGGGTWTLVDQAPKNFSMVIFYRGLHCPVCKMYLTKLNGLIDMAAEAGVNVVAVSMDPEDRATQTKTDWELGNIDLAYGATADDVRNCLFWVRPDGRLYLIDISNMPWSRPDVEFLLSKVQFAMDNGYPARGTTA